MSAVIRFLDPELAKVVNQEVTQTGNPDGILVPVILTVDQTRFNRIWNSLFSGVSREQSEGSSVKDLSVKRIVDSLIPNDEFKKAFEKSIPLTKITELNQNNEVQVKIHTSHIERSKAYSTTKLDLVNGISTELDAETIRAIDKTCVDNPELAKTFGLQYMERNREVWELVDQSAWQIGVNPKVWQLGYKGSQIQVAVLDSGADETTQT